MSPSKSKPFRYSPLKLSDGAVPSWNVRDNVEISCDFCIRLDKYSFLPLLPTRNIEKIEFELQNRCRLSHDVNSEWLDSVTWPIEFYEALNEVKHIAMPANKYGGRQPYDV